METNELDDTPLNSNGIEHFDAKTFKCDENDALLQQHYS